MHLYELLRKEPGGVNNRKGALSNSLRLEANTSGTRLLNLHKKRLVKKIDETRNGEGSGGMRKYSKRTKYA